MAPKPFRSYQEQVQLLAGRGMDVGRMEDAVEVLRQANYYRLSGYAYPFRAMEGTARGDQFVPGTRFEDVWALHQFDADLRAACFAALAPIEIFLRARLAHELGAVDPCAHLEPTLLGPEARKQGRVSVEYKRWLDKYRRAVRDSHEDFVEHHRRAKAGILPIWAATEVLDWGSLTRLYGFAPRAVQEAVAHDFKLNGPQLSSWLKSLNIVRNVCAHHGRLYNKVHTLTPRMPTLGRAAPLDEVRKLVEVDGPGRPRHDGEPQHSFGQRTFDQLTLIQHLLSAIDPSMSGQLPAVLSTFPATDLMPERVLGAPKEWRALELWAQ